MNNTLIKYFKGYKQNNWEILDINYINNKYLIKLRCICGYSKDYTYSGFQKAIGRKSCLFCTYGENTKELIGKKFGRLTVLDNPRVIKKGKLHRTLFVKCDCGVEYNILHSTLQKTRSCKSCSHNYYPGKILDGIEFISRGSSSKKWKMKCRCGNIFEKIPKKHNEKLIGCGCDHFNYYLNGVKNKIGKKFGQLRVIGYKKANRHYLLICKCKCGKKIEIKNGHECKQKSCGCLIFSSYLKGSDCPKAKFKEFEISSMREMWKTKNYSLHDLSAMFNTNKNYISRIVHGHIWKHI